ncbi:hypothetical protein E8E12_007123 [Didymella heteroderae]|uniref:Xylanolytic transcriptional activator regulatory domain-containing protein n=1 Tax=Didymella heteroderae TaxID=1769908 RepID=A0A9P4WM51_9PLEO|nr:hypothetical protein E8E12_007123 [Didymella heteroderae]
MTEDMQLFHILHDPTFNNQYEEFEQAPDSMPLSWLALLFAILGTSIMALGPSSNVLSELSRKGSVFEQIAELSERYRNAALRCLEADNYLWQQNVTTLQALIVLIYGINHSHGQTWTLLGMTYHIALSLGCHVDPSEFSLDVISSEERRRCWAGVMMLYMIQNTSMGNLGPNPWDASEGVQMPSDLNDIDLVADEYVLPAASNRATQMSYLLLKFRLYHISDEIASVIRNSPQPQPSLIERLDRSIAGEQRSWHDKYTTHQALAMLPTYHRVHFEILQGYAHQLMLLLHNHAMRSPMTETSQFRRSASKVLSSAKEQLHIHDVFFTEPDYAPFGWYLRGICSFHAYHAAVSLVTILVEQPWDETHEAILPLLQRCTERFETLAEVSVICRKAAPVLKDML